MSMISKHKSKKFLYWLPTIVWMAVIFYLSSRTSSNLQSMFPFVKDFNVGHFIAYFFLGMVCYYGITKTSTTKQPYLWILLIAFLYGLTDEFHQSFVPTRDASLSDLIRDVIGAGLAIVIIILFKKFYFKKNKND